MGIIPGIIRMARHRNHFLRFSKLTESYFKCMQFIMHNCDSVKLVLKTLTGRKESEYDKTVNYIANGKQLTERKSSK